MTGRPSARERRDLSIDEIVDRASRLMADVGVEALTMRRVAEACGVTPMALYYYVANKEDLLTLVVDRVMRTVLADDWRQGTWREAMLRFGRLFRGVLLANPGAGAVFVRRPIVSPNLAAVTERLFAILERGGVIGTAAAEATDAIVLLTMGSIANDLTRPAAIRETLLDHLPPDQMSLTQANIGAYAHRDPEARYLLALGWLLDGIQRSSDGKARS